MWKERIVIYYAGRYEEYLLTFCRGGREICPPPPYLSLHHLRVIAADVTCENDKISDLSFDKFNKLYFEKFNTRLDPNWLGWFVGFAEGDGYLGINENTPVFVLTQKESKILYEIRDILNFGYVKEFDKFSRFIVRDQSSVFLLFHLFNGNLHIKHKIGQLVEWSKLFNNKLRKTATVIPTGYVEVITEPVKLSFNNSWFSGFVDAEGCFNVYVSKNNKGISLRFIVDQQEGLLVFEELKNILGTGSIYARKNNNYRFAATKLDKLALVIEYFNIYILRTKKQLAFEKWKIVYYCVLNKEHKSSEGMNKLKELSLLINKDNDQV